MIESRALVKISGEMLFLDSIATSVANLVAQNIAVSVVVGGGNIIRGRSCNDIDRTVADCSGMLATVINGMLFADRLSKMQLNTMLFSTLELPFGINKFDPTTIKYYVNNSNVLIFVGGTGMPNVSTDTAAVIYSSIIKANLLLKATKTDGIYDCDPETNKNAKYLSKLTYDECLEKNINVMDTAAFALAKEHKIKILIFSGKEENCLVKAMQGAIKTSCVYL